MSHQQFTASDAIIMWAIIAACIAVPAMVVAVLA